LKFTSTRSVELTNIKSRGGDMARFCKTGFWLAATVGLLSTAFGANGQEVRQHGPGQRVELDNPSVLVLRIVLGPHEKTGMHDVSARLVIWLTEAHLRDTKPDGSVRQYDRAAGAVDWVSAQQHAGENLSDQPVEFLAVLPKGKALSAPAREDHNHR
jgi:hypothetical protein